jgi:hypothetical protein
MCSGVLACFTDKVLGVLGPQLFIYKGESYANPVFVSAHTLPQAPQLRQELEALSWEVPVGAMIT